MNHRRAWAVARKEFLHILRDPRSLAMAIAMPMVLLLLYGYALTLDADNVPMIVWDQGQSPASRGFSQAPMRSACLRPRFVSARAMSPPAARSSASACLQRISSIVRLPRVPRLTQAPAPAPRGARGSSA